MKPVICDDKAGPAMNFPAKEFNKVKDWLMVCAKNPRYSRVERSKFRLTVDRMYQVEKCSDAIRLRESWDDAPKGS